MRSGVLERGLHGSHEFLIRPYPRNSKKVKHRLRYRNLTAVVTVVLWYPLLVLPQDASDAFGVSKAELSMGNSEIPTVQSVDKLGEEANALFDASDCDHAVVALDAFGKKANQLANIILAGLAPFSNAERDEKNQLAGSDRQDMFWIAEFASFYQKERNRAMVKRGECLIKLGKTEEAVISLVRALDIDRHRRQSMVGTGEKSTVRPNWL